MSATSSSPSCFERKRKRAWRAPSGHPRYVYVLECPRENADDEFPPFSPGKKDGALAQQGRAKFPLDQFCDSLKHGIWPKGMKISVSSKLGNHKNKTYIIGDVQQQKQLRAILEYGG